VSVVGVLLDSVQNAAHEELNIPQSPSGPVDAGESSTKAATRDCNLLRNPK
jgi:hypothetical protein